MLFIAEKINDNDVLVESHNLLRSAMRSARYSKIHLLLAINHWNTQARKLTYGGPLGLSVISNLARINS